MSDSPANPRPGLQRSTSPGATERPEPTTPDATGDPTRTGELASEGGSYGDLAQERRARQDAAGNSLASPAGAPRVGMPLVWALLAVPLAAILLWFGTSAC